MGLKSGSFLWNRVRIPNIPANSVAFNVDTQLKQPNRGFSDYSPNEPTLGLVTAPPGPFGTGPVSRIEVMMLAPTGKWGSVTHSEPFLNPATDTIWVTFFNSLITPVVDLNVLFWDPHAIFGPGQAVHYAFPVIP